jgi:glycosyltransferase involved in cell wall biosynthesis
MEIEAISCIEAFATGLVPVIADSDNSATPQFALDSRSVFRAGDARDLARAIDYWLDRPQERCYMEKRYAAEAHKYSLANSVKLFEQMLNDEISHESVPAQPARITLLSSIKRQAIRLRRHRSA